MARSSGPGGRTGPIWEPAGPPDQAVPGVPPLEARAASGPSREVPPSTADESARNSAASWASKPGARARAVVTADSGVAPARTSRPIIRTTSRNRDSSRTCAALDSSPATTAVAAPRRPPSAAPTVADVTSPISRPEIPAAEAPIRHVGRRRVPCRPPRPGRKRSVPTPGHIRAITRGGEPHRRRPRRQDLPVPASCGREPAVRTGQARPDNGQNRTAAPSSRQITMAARPRAGSAGRPRHQPPARPAARSEQPGSPR